MSKCRIGLYFVWLALIAAFGFGCGGKNLGFPASTASPTLDNGQYGSVLNLEEFASNPQALPAAALLQPPVAPALPAKVLLTNLPAVAFSGRVFKAYGTSPVLTNGVLYETEIIPNSGHGQLLVGYDDTIGQPGAFLVQNSFGTNWPPASAGPSPAPPGRIYWSYNSFLITQRFAAVAYPRDPSAPGGTILTSAGPSAPAASITRAFQWAEPKSNKVYMVFMHQFAAPVQITTIDVAEPSPGTETANAGYNQFISTGYTYLVRSDGKEFLPGNYALAFQVQLLDGTVVVYKGVVPVGDTQPTPLPSAEMASAGAILDTLLQPVLLSP